MRLRLLICGASMRISAAFHYSGRSNVMMGGTWCLMARSQMKFSVDKMHVLSPEYKSIDQCRKLFEQNALAHMFGKSMFNDWDFILQ